MPIMHPAVISHATLPAKKIWCGLRALAMTTIKEKLGDRHEVVDRQFAHAPMSKIDRAYDRAKFLDDRTNMMQELAHYIHRIQKQQ